jgi:hypothetical protein
LNSYTASARLGFGVPVSTFAQTLSRDLCNRGDNDLPTFDRRRTMNIFYIIGVVVVVIIVAGYLGLHM